MNKLMVDQEVDLKSLEALTGIPYKTLHGYSRGISANPTGDTVAKIAKALKVSERELRFGIDDEHARIVDLRKIPLLTANKVGTLGRGQSPVEELGKVVLMTVQSDSLSDQAFGLTVEDESGLPEIKPGETLVFDPGLPLMPGKLTLAVIKKDKLVVVGRYRPANIVGGEDFMIVTINPDFPDVRFDKDNPAGLVARAVQHIRKFD